MAITFGEARKLVAKYAGSGGKCDTSEEVRLFVQEVLQYMLLSGQYGSIRKYTFYATKGAVTLPYELEVPLKIKIDGCVGSVWNKWYEFYNDYSLSGSRCYDAGDSLIEDPNEYPTVYDLPSGGAQVGVQPMCQEDEGSFVLVKGQDIWGKEVYTSHKGEQIHGEHLSLKKGQLTTSHSFFKTISSILKSRTNGYVQLWWVKVADDTKGFLAEYSPVEEVPQYRRYNLQIPDCPRTAKLTILGKIRLKSFYSDSDILPFDNIAAIKTAAQSRNAQDNNDTQRAQAQDSYLLDLINRENTYKKPNVGQPIEVFTPVSAGRVRGIVGFGRSRSPWRLR